MGLKLHCKRNWNELHTSIPPFELRYIFIILRLVACCLLWSRSLVNHPLIFPIESENWGHWSMSRDFLFQALSTMAISWSCYVSSIKRKFAQPKVQPIFRPSILHNLNLVSLLNKQVVNTAIISMLCCFCDDFLHNLRWMILNTKLSTRMDCAQKVTHLCKSYNVVII